MSVCENCDGTGRIVSTIRSGVLEICPVCEPDELRQVCWMIEWPAEGFTVARWWNPIAGWVIDPRAATRFCRHVDAQSVISTSKFGRPVHPTEHVFLLGVGQ